MLLMLDWGWCSVVKRHFPNLRGVSSKRKPQSDNIGCNEENGTDITEWFDRGQIEGIG
jgi:hypothetical protein